MLQESSGRPFARRRPARILGPGLIFVTLMAAGCGSSDQWDRQPVSGTVTLDGQPLGDGAILLEATSPGDAPWMAVGATIRNGAFAIARDHGPRPSTYRVRIYSSSGVQAPPAANQDERTQRPMVERLPAIYNANSEMRVDVTAVGPNRFRFELHAAAGG